MDALAKFLLEHEDGHRAGGQDEVLELAHRQHYNVHDVVVLLHQVEHGQDAFDLDLINLVAVTGDHAGHEGRAGLRAVQTTAAAHLRQSSAHTCAALLILAEATAKAVQHVDRLLVEWTGALLVRQVLQHLTVALQCGAEARVLTPKLMDLALRRALLHLAALEFGLRLLHFGLDVS